MVLIWTQSAEREPFRMHHEKPWPYYPQAFGGSACTWPQHINPLVERGYLYGFNMELYQWSMLLNSISLWKKCLYFDIRGGKVNPANAGKWAIRSTQRLWIYRTCMSIFPMLCFVVNGNGADTFVAWPVESNMISRLLCHSNIKIYISC